MAYSVHLHHEECGTLKNKLSQSSDCRRHKNDHSQIWEFQPTAHVPLDPLVSSSSCCRGPEGLLNTEQKSGKGGMVRRNGGKLRETWNMFSKFIVVNPHYLNLMGPTRLDMVLFNPQPKPHESHNSGVWLTRASG